MSQYGLKSMSSRVDRTPEEHEKWKKYKRDREAARRKRIDVQIAIYKQNAKVRGIEFLLTDAQAEEIMKSDCAYCGEHADPWNGMDRRENSKGYTVENTVSACSMCNMMKKHYSEQEFLEKCAKITSYRSGK